MSTATGRESTFAITQGSPWGTAVACGAGDGALYLSESINQARETLIDPSSGQPWPLSADQGAITCQGDFEVFARYDCHKFLQALSFSCGSCGAPVSTGSGAYTATIGLTDNIDGIFATLAFDKTTAVHEIPSAKVDGFTLQGEAGQPVRATFHTICDGRNVNTGSSGTNDQVSILTVTTAERENRIMFSDAAFWMNAASGDALDSGDVIYPRSFTLEWRRNTAGDQTADGDDAIDEPTGGVPECRLTLEFPKYDSNGHLTNFDAQTQQKMSIAFTGALIGGANSYFFKLLFPNLIPTEVTTSIAGQDKIPQSIGFTAIGRETAPTGMTGLEEPFEIQIQSTMSASPLA